MAASGSLYCSTGSGSAWPGAIIGDLPNPFGCATLGAGQFFTTGDQDLGGDGELSGQLVMTVEFWFQASGWPAGNELICFGPMTATGVGTRQWWFTLNTTGTISFSARSATPASIGATGTTAILTPPSVPNSNPIYWYHVVGRIDGTNLKIFVNGVEEGSTSWGGSSVESRGTTAGSMDTVIQSPNASTYAFDEFAIYRSSLDVSRILAHYQAGTQRGFRNGANPGAHVIAALDAISSRAPRNINAGSRVMWASFYAGGSALDELQSARQAENVDATTFAAKDGTVVFLDAAHRSSSPYNTAQVTLGDAGGAEIAYEDVGLDYSDDTIANEWNVTGVTAGTDGTTQTVSDATSIASYGRRPQSITGLPVHDTDCATIATAMLAKYKDPILRGTSITMNPGDPSVAEVVFDRDLADRINVKRTPPGGGARISQDLFIQQIQISGDNSGAPWSVTWGLSPL